jgi:hypothetical protein
MQSRVLSPPQGGLFGFDPEPLWGTVSAGKPLKVNVISNDSPFERCK